MSPDASRFPTHSLKIEKVKEHIGAIVTGIDLAQPIDGSTRKKLYVVVNNKVEGSSPLTVRALVERMVEALAG